MASIGYFELLSQRAFLSQSIFDGVKAADIRLSLINKKITKIESNPLVFDHSFIFKRPGYTSRIVKLLSVQASRGSDFCANDLAKYADWVIQQRSCDQ
jgi:hypothetical protein